MADQVRYVVLRCLQCRWTWQAYVFSDGEPEPCPECNSAQVDVERELEEGC